MKNKSYNVLFLNQISGKWAKWAIELPKRKAVKAAESAKRFAIESQVKIIAA